MSSRLDVQNASREELIQRIQELEDQVQEIDSGKASRSSINVLLNEFAEDDAAIDDYTEDPVVNREVLTSFVEEFRELQQTVAKLDEIAREETSLTGDDDLDDWQRVLNKAAELSDHRDHAVGNGEVKLGKHEIATALDVSPRWARERMKEEFSEKEGVRFQDYKANGNNGKMRPMALFVDVEFWRDGE